MDGEYFGHLLLTSLERVTMAMIIMEARMTALETLYVGLAQRQRKAEDVATEIFVGISERLENDVGKNANCGPPSDLADGKKAHFHHSFGEAATEIVLPIPLCESDVLERTNTTSSVEFAFHEPNSPPSASVERTWIEKSYVSAKVSYTPVTEPWRRSKAPWTRNNTKIGKYDRYLNSLLNKASPQNTFAEDFMERWHNRSRKDSAGLLLYRICERALNEPRFSRLYVEILRQLLDRGGNAFHKVLWLFLSMRAESGCVHDLVTGELADALRSTSTKRVKRYEPEDEFVKKARTVEEKKNSRWRLCGYLRVLGELVKHGILNDIALIDEMLKNLHKWRKKVRLFFGGSDLFDPSFAMKWLFTLKRKFKDGLFEYDYTYHDDLFSEQTANSSLRWTSLFNKWTGNIRKGVELDDAFASFGFSLLDREDMRTILLNHINKQVLADDGRNAESVAVYAVQIAKKIANFDRGMDENDCLQMFFARLWMDIRDKVEKLMASPDYETSPEMNLKAHMLMTTLMRFIGAVFMQNLKDPVDTWGKLIHLGEMELLPVSLIDSQSEARKRTKFSRMYMDKWFRATWMEHIYYRNIHMNHL
ncbi:hypothetical protein QR680_007690 [Steinernema hermaphroditum]|uniref:MI domain-containing protein n=1 Tax=Steinernema hermaphroditum TaxID=289476 RepID=A0AA39IG56_9BILA|nr:hypothetical protein QR680_007690 [Steinernema hermaphroditum]